MFRFKSLSGSILITLVCVGMFCSSATAASLIVENDKLMGATDVSVEGSLYNVAFVDDLAVNLFQVDGEYIFTFDNLTSAHAASQALLDQVFINDYDNDPTLINGIDYDRAGYIMTPYDVQYYLQVSMVMNYSSTLSQEEDRTAKYFFLPTTNTGASNQYAWAVWTPISAPIPGSILLAGAGLVSLIGIRRKI